MPTAQQSTACECSYTRALVMHENDVIATLTG